MEINYSYETDFALSKEEEYSDWIYRVLVSEGFVLEELSYVFCDDNYLLALNQEYLNHDTFTDIITFDYCEGKKVYGDIFISIERVKDNAETHHVGFLDELKRVMVHGLLHLMGYGDKLEEEVLRMRKKEEEKMKLFHVEH